LQLVSVSSHFFRRVRIMFHIFANLFPPQTRGPLKWMHCLLIFRVQGTFLLGINVVKKNAFVKKQSSLKNRRKRANSLPGTRGFPSSGAAWNLIARNKISHARLAVCLHFTWKRWCATSHNDQTLLETVKYFDPLKLLPASSPLRREQVRKWMNEWNESVISDTLKVKLSLSSVWPG